MFKIKLGSPLFPVVTGDMQEYLDIPPDINQTRLRVVSASVATVSSSGLITVQVRNITQGYDMLSTPITIDANEHTSHTATTKAIISASNLPVALADLLAIDVDTAGTGAKGLCVTLGIW